MKLPGLAALALAALVTGSALAKAGQCPSTQEAEASITTYITKEYWSEGQRQTWKVADVKDFEFGPLTYGKIIKKDMDYSGPREVCPARVEFSFTVLHMDGSIEETEMGAGKVFYFYHDDFGDWIFKIG